MAGVESRPAVVRGKDVPRAVDLEKSATEVQETARKMLA
jgi:hypothetical protein